jgi:hypothetical protein
LQVIPLTVNEVGDESLDVHVPWNPNDALPPGLIEPLYEALVAVTVSPLCVSEPSFHELVTFWSPGKVNFTVQLLIAALPVLLIVTLAVNPPGHSLFFVYATWQPEPPLELALGDGDAEADADGLVDGVADALGLVLVLGDALALALGLPVDEPLGSPYMMPRPLVPTYTRP